MVGAGQGIARHEDGRDRARIGELVMAHSFLTLLLPAAIFGVASFTLCMFAGPYVIRFLRRMKAGTMVRVDGPQTHLIKVGTPVMGGLLFSGVTTLLTIAFNLFGHYSQLLNLGALVSCSALGAVDDLMKTLRVGSAGLRARFKLAWTVVIAVVIVLALHVPRLLAHPNDVWVPWVGFVDFGWAYWPLAIFAIVATAHAVNLTDGLDGLAAGTGAVAFATFGAIALLSSPPKPFLATFCFTMVGALLAFLWFNVFPARIIMGDTGSLALGATLATVALMLNQALVLPIVGFVFVIETVSVIVQVSYYRLTGGKRILRGSPLHIHLELIGWHENEVTQRFWIVSMLAGMAGFVLAFS